jgi:hypothetical protein
MTASTSTYQLPGALWYLRFTAMALRTLHAHVQRKLCSRESVGQLYSRDLTTDCIVIEEATVLTPKWSARARVQFDPRRAAAERDKKFERGLHCVGLWHTHPEALPIPSPDDKVLAREHALSAKGQLTGLVFAIVGTQPIPAGLRVWVDDGEALHLAERLPSQVRPAGRSQHAPKD